MTTWRTVRTLRGLVFDIENKPGTYGPGDYTHPKVTAVGWKWLDGKKAHGHCLDRRDHEQMVFVAEKFRTVWTKADFVVGHNIRRHDQKILDGLYTALGLPLLPRRRMVDTYLDLPKMEGLSRSLENLAYRWESPVPKMSMPEAAWEWAYDGIPEYVEMMRKRVVTDCEINVWLYHEEVKSGLLTWR